MSENKQKPSIFLNYKKENLIFSIIKSPETVLPTAFFVLCVLGTILLLLPFSTHHPIAFLDALFTSVSASCVTGLTVLSTGEDFTLLGQLIILLLIQAGGLGIMSITSIFFVIFGKRMSLSHEKATRNILDVESHDEIKNSLKLIFKYTFLTEFFGMYILTLCFLFKNYPVLSSLKNSVFLAISAFCNAGFVLNNLGIIEYQNNPIILYTIAILVVLGAMSPAISVLLPQWIRGKKLSPQTVLVLYTTLILIVFGAIIFLISETEGVLTSMPWTMRINNTLFTAMASKTAGFTSVDTTNLGFTSYVLMLILMTIGGSPGGTAGGIKTCTVGILFLTCYNFIREKNNIIRNKNITYETVQKAMTLVVVYLIVLMVIVFMLITTQSLSIPKLIFEATSALGTVGLSMGITPNLDEVGKVIIILAMFIGRVAPASFLCYLNTKNCDSNISYPDAKITLT